MELIGALDRVRLERELRRREMALREAERAVEADEPKPDSVGVRAVAAADPPKPQSAVARYASAPQGWWECDFCGRGFHGYGQLLNHNCHAGD